MGTTSDEWAELEGEGGEFTLVVRGEVDIASETDLIDKVDEMVGTSTHPVLIDLSDVDFMDSAGLRAILRLRQRHGDAVRVGAVSAAVRRLFEIAGVVDLLPSTDHDGDSNVR